VSEFAVVECESGDEVSVYTGRHSVLLSLDDVDRTIVPTARLTTDEAKRLGAMLLAASSISSELPL